MGQAIAHRGPDSFGQWCKGEVGLVHRRLSVIDLDNGNQPIHNEDGSIRVIFNGEIYNYHDIRRTLKQRGHRFQTNSDTEIIVHLYEDHGSDLVRYLRGMFAFALWDDKKKELLLARDRLGIKPLYYYQDAEKAIFASEIKGILAHANVDRDIDPCAIDSYLTFGFVPGPKSIFRKILKLQPAHTLSISWHRWWAFPQRYWTLQWKPDYGKSVDEWEGQINAKVKECSRAHMVADVPVGAFLSGGIDSSVIVSCNAKEFGKSLKTFSIGFEDAQFNELGYAKQVSNQYHTQHIEEIATPDTVSLVDELAWHFDEPFADSSAIPMYLLSQVARRHVKVALSGDGGDEAFGGYRRYSHDLKEAVIRRLLPSWLRNRAVAPLSRSWPRNDRLPKPFRLKSFLHNISLEGHEAYANTVSIARLPWRHDLLAPSIRKELHGFKSEHSISNMYYRSADVLTGMLSADTQVILPDGFLVKVDRASMAHGLEVRPPLLDHELLELTAQIPSSLKIRHGTTKWIFKQAFRKELPKCIRNRTKRGFDIPLENWLSGPLKEMFYDKICLSDSVIKNFVNMEFVDTMWHNHLKGYKGYGNSLWSILVLSAWADRHLKAGPLSMPPESPSNTS